MVNSHCDPFDCLVSMSRFVVLRRFCSAELMVWLAYLPKFVAYSFRICEAVQSLNLLASYRLLKSFPSSLLLFQPVSFPFSLVAGEVAWGGVWRIGWLEALDFEGVRGMVNLDKYTRSVGGESKGLGWLLCPFGEERGAVVYFVICCIFRVIITQNRHVQNWFMFSFPSNIVL